MYFADADCYSRMTRVRMVPEHPGLVVRHHQFENFPAGVVPHTTAPLDYLIAGLAAVLGGLISQPLDLAGALISPLLALATGWFLWWWARRAKLRQRWAGLLLFALSPILAQGTALGRPDHQALLILLVLVALAAEWSLREQPSRGWALVSGLSWGLALWVSLYEPLVILLVLLGAQMIFARPQLLHRSRRGGWLALGIVLLVAALVERRWLELPPASLHDSYARWSATIGELSHVGLASATWWQWLRIHRARAGANHRRALAEKNRAAMGDPADGALRVHLRAGALGLFPRRCPLPNDPGVAHVCETGLARRAPRRSGFPALSANLGRYDLA